MVIGANDDFVNDYYKVFFGGEGSFYKKIRYEDTYPNSDNFGEVLESGTIDTWHKAEIIRNKDWLVTTFDGKIASAIKAGDKADGYIGFCSHNNNIEIDNLKVEKYDSPKNTSFAELNISDKRTDVYETELTVENPPENDLLYKYYRNGVWINDTKNKSFKDLTMQDPRNIYNYEIYAVNKEGVVVGVGKTTISLGEIPNDMFYMDNLRYKVETGGAYGLVDYHPNNRGYGTNGLTRNWDDDYGNYNEIPEEFYDAGYIQTLRSYSRYLPAAVYSDDDEWMKFDIHNKSATVYVLFSESVIPSWIYNGNWKKTYHYFDLLVANRNVGHTYGVYKKHFTVKEGESRTIYLGPNGTNAFYHYCVIVVPDKD